MVNMKKLISLVLALMICMSVTCTAFAAAYTASVENKGAPAVVEIQDAEIISSSIFSWSFFLSSSSGTPIIRMLEHFILSWRL